MGIKNKYLIGCDVGTGSVRAGVFDIQGKMISKYSNDIKIWRPKSDFVEQSSEDIWRACCQSVAKAIEKADVDCELISGIGFDATCSLVVLDKNDHPISVSPTSSDEQNIIVWMDHRAKHEANQINKTQHRVLKYVGGTISPEMQTPKLLWLKKNKPESWRRADKFLDLADFMVYKATGIDIRSICTTTCKWTYLGHEDPVSDGSVGRWDSSFFEKIGLNEFVEEKFARIGTQVQPVGEPVGNGLTEKAATEMGLKEGTPVGVAIIDAHAGGLGLLGMQLSDNKQDFQELEDRLALIGGTSSCHMAVSEDPRFIEGVWGPYYSGMIPGMWLNEGGQSATGALIDHIIFSSKQSDKLQKVANDENKTVYQVLNERLKKLAAKKNLKTIGELTKDVHVLPYFHGNRSPRANASLVGSIFGLKLSSTIDDLALLYLATIQAVAYGTRHIIEELNKQGYSICEIMATGGGTKNALFLQEHSDICDCKISLPAEQDAVLLGSAILGAVASGEYPTVYEAMKNMDKQGKVIKPKSSEIKEFHDLKYEVFHKMYRDEISYLEIMERY